MRSAENLPSLPAVQAAPQGKKTPQDEPDPSSGCLRAFQAMLGAFLAMLWKL
jgi:hypothetical protein